MRLFSGTPRRSFARHFNIEVKALVVFLNENSKTCGKTRRRENSNSLSRSSVSIVSKAKGIASTNNNLAGDLVRQYFGTEAKVVIIFRDEDPKELDASGWVGITKMECSPKIQGMVIGGDTKQLRPTVISNTANPRTNEFSGQLTLSLAERLRQVNFPCVKLVQQHRMRPIIAKFPSYRVYDKQMQNAETVHSIKVNATYLKMLMSFTGERKQDAEMGHVILSVVGSTCDLDQTKSKFNLQHVRLVAEILVRNYRESKVINLRTFVS